MRYDESKSFPYPVLRSGSDDYTDGAFQATLQRSLSNAAQDIHIDAHFMLSEPAVRGLITNQQAEYALLVEARETYFRDLVTSSSPKISTDYSGGRIKGPVSLLPYVVVTKQVQDFSSPHFNPEYRGRKFLLEPGDVVALDAPSEFYVGQEIFAHIGTVFAFVEDKSKKVRTGELEIGLDAERVQILVSKEQKRLLDTAREQKVSRPVLMAGVYMPTLMQVLSFMARGSEDFVDRKWHRAITAKCDDLGVELNEEIDFLSLAQRLLNYPISTLNKTTFTGG